MMITVTETKDGCVLPVRAQPGARKTVIVGEYANSLKVAVTAPADQGKANKALAEVLAHALGVSRSQVELITGQTSREKRFLVRGIGQAEVARRLSALLGD